MPSLRQTQGGRFVLCFRYQERQFQRSLKTTSREAALALKGRAEHLLYQLHTGQLSLPDESDIGDFLVSGEVRPHARRAPTSVPAFGDLIEPYLLAHRGQKADSSLQTEQIHLRNLSQTLGANAKRPLNRLTAQHLEQALQVRAQQVATTTVQKERQTVVNFFRWVMREKYCDQSPAESLPVYRPGTRQDKFRTRQEAEQIIARGGLSDEETQQLWESLYLSPGEIGEVLHHVRARAQHDFVHPMVAIAAYTGMRRGEILRLRWSDIDFESNVLQARSRKQSRREQETCRLIDLHPELKAILEDFRKERSRGQFVICHTTSPQPLSVHTAWYHLCRALRDSPWEREMPSGRKRIVIGFHTFRHSFASNLAAQGVDQRLIDGWLGHQTEAMRKRYQHLSPKTRQAAIERLSLQPQKRPDSALSSPAKVAVSPADAVPRSG